MPAPANDNFADAQVLTGASGTVTGTNVDATFEVGEPRPDDGWPPPESGTGPDGDKTVWYQWTAPAAGPATFDTIGSSFDTLLHVYTGDTLDALTLIAFNDDIVPAVQSSVAFTAETGTVYRVRVNGWGTTDYGDIVLNWAGTGAAPPPVVWTVTGVDVGTGGSPIDVPGAQVRSITWALNEPVSATIDIERVDAHLDQFTDPTREIQIHRDDTIMFWGPTVRSEITQDVANIQCADPAWYLTRRFFGKADRTNLLTNGDFEDGTTGWSAAGLTPVIDTTRAVHGGRSVRLSGPSAGHDSYLSQTYTHIQSYPTGDLLTVAAEVWVPSVDYRGDAFDGLQLYAERRNSGGTLLDTKFTTLDPGKMDQWVHVEVAIPSVLNDDTIEVRLYPPFGVAWWDLATLTAMESLSFIEQDMATIIRGVVFYAQDRFPGFTHGKSNLYLDVDFAPTGVTMSRTWQFADHENIGAAIRAFTEQKSGIDWRVDYTDTTRTMVVGHPHLGVTHTDLTLEWGVNVSKFRWSHDRTQGATSTVVLGPGDGPDRQEGGATLGSPAGPTLEDVTVATDGTPIAALDLAAQERLALLTNPEVLEVVAAGILGSVSVGDWLPVLIDWGGPVSVNDTYRIVRATVDPANDSLTITLNLRDPETPEEAMARFPRAVDACQAPGGGVWVVGSDGGVGAFGGATFHGSLPEDGIIPFGPVVAIVPHGAGGYWLVGADTGVFAYGDAPGRSSYSAMVDTEYPRGDRAIVAAEAWNPDTDDSLIMIADDGDTYIAATP